MGATLQRASATADGQRAVRRGARQAARQANVPSAPAGALEPRAAPWVCRPEIAPRVWREEGALGVESNGSEGCYGGWELVYEAASWPAPLLDFGIEASASGLPHAADNVIVEAFWDDAAGAEVEWEPIVVLRQGPPRRDGACALQLGGRLRVPGGAARLRVRCGLRWADRGRIRWHGWRLRPAPPAPAPRRLRLGVASARPPKQEPWIDSAANAAHFLEQCRRAGEAGVDLVCLPELMLTIGMPITPETVHAAALPVPGPWLAPFQEIARAHHMGICFSTYERAGANGEVVYNTAVLLGQDGAFAGKYRKVHLALSEARVGVTAGRDFPVFDFHGVTVGMAICMDSSPLETARILGRQGAEIMLMPIMGDFRATAWAVGDGRFDHERWELIQRAHAFDNHLYVVAARNMTQGSAITAPWGEILAYDDGASGLIWADVNLDDVRSHPRGSTIRSVLWSMRRPAVYEALVAAEQVPAAAAAARR